jgi:hypothetical protein
MRRDGRTGDWRLDQRGGHQQFFDVTAALGGPQDIVVKTQRQPVGEAIGSVNMSVGGLLMRFHSRSAIDAMVEAWNDQSEKAGMLSSESESTLPNTSAKTSGLVAIVEVPGPATFSGHLVHPRAHNSWLDFQYGNVQFRIHDTTALAAMTAGLREAAKLAQTAWPTAAAAPNRPTAAARSTRVAPRRASGPTRGSAL